MTTNSGQVRARFTKAEGTQQIGFGTVAIDGSSKKERQ